MKKYMKLVILVLISFTLIQCEFEVSEFGFDGSIKGTVMDNNGNPVYADINSNTLIVKLLGEGDEQAIEIRVAGDGTYQNTKMFPKSHEVWVEGPIVSSTPVTVDFSADASQEIDFTVTPLISPVLNNASGSGTTITVDYAITPNGVNTVEKMEVYVSTVKFPTAAIGSRDNVYSTATVELTELSGSIDVSELVAGTYYFLRIGAQADGAASMNYSNQIEVGL